MNEFIVAMKTFFVSFGVVITSISYQKERSSSENLAGGLFGAVLIGIGVNL